MILVTDVHYHTDNSAMAAGVCISDWTDENPFYELTVSVPVVLPYQPGSFYRRELPPLKTLLESLPLKPDIIVIDGFVLLGAKQKPGLGWYLFEALKHAIPVVGVAKNAFEGTPTETVLLRGISSRPLYITCLGMALEQAKEAIGKMHGSHRIPTILKRVDRLSKEASAGTFG